jgi:hypothetical protein
VLKKDQDNHNFEVIREPDQIDEVLSKTYTKDELERLIT